MKKVAVALTLSTRVSYSADEELAFRHVRRYLADHDCYVVMPRDHPAEYPGFAEKRFPSRYFGSVRAHTALLLSTQFWEAFEEYEFLLVHHLDALVFSDQLLRWCDAGYDYIGAPWLVCSDTPHIFESKVGNGGLSLRRVQAALRVIRSNRPFVDPDEYWRHYCARTPRFGRWLNLPRKHLKTLPVFNNARWHIRQWVLKTGVHEDRFWAEFAMHYDPQYRIAPVDVAMHFAFEAEPRACFARIGHRLPFGCHRWARFDRQFWEPYLLRQGPGSEARPIQTSGPASLFRRPNGHPAR